MTSIICQNRNASRFSLCTILFLLLSLNIASTTHAAGMELDRQQDSFLFESLAGSTPDDQFFLGMFTYHFTQKSRKIRNWQQNLIGLQYDGFFVATFENSFYNRCWAAGFGRELFSSAMANNWSFVTGYRVGGILGYEDGEAPFADSSPVIPLVELYAQSTFHEHFGLELMLTTSISLGFFYQF